MRNTGSQKVCGATGGSNPKYTAGLQPVQPISAVAEFAKPKLTADYFFVDTLSTHNADLCRPIVKQQLVLQTNAVRKAAKLFHSLHPTELKINIAINFIDRVQKITTNQYQFISWQLRMHRQPRNFEVMEIHQQHYETPPPEAPPPNTTPENDSHTTQTNSAAMLQTWFIPFIPQLTTNITHILNTDFPHVKLVYRSIRTIKNKS